MSLHKAKTLFCIVAMAVGVLLFAVGSTPYWLASMIVLGGALPGWRLAEKAMLAQAFDQAATFLEGLRRADEASQQPDRVLQDSPAPKQHGHLE